MRLTATCVLTALLLPCLSSGADWTDWRGPEGNGISPETDLVESWSPDGENLLWRAPFPGRSTPVVMGDRLYALNSAGEADTLQERVLCVNADTGVQIWEYRYNVYHSDVPPRRIAWSAPVMDPETGNVYTFGVAGMMTALSGDGKLLWKRSLIEEFGTLSTHGGRTVSPVIEGELVITSFASSGWGAQARPGHRFIAMDKKTGEIIWISGAGTRPYDTTYSTPVAAEINGTRLLIAGSGDGSVLALKPQTGEIVWRYAMSKRGVNTEVAVHGTTVFASHGEENLNTSEMGLLVALDGTARGELAEDDVKWKTQGFLAGYSSPVVHESVLYQIDNGSNLYSFDVETGENLWVQNLGTIQRASPVFADGKIYVGNDNGDFFILKPTREKCHILDKDRLGSETEPEQITASAAISGGRIFVVTDAAMYCFGKKNTTDTAPAASGKPARSTEPPTHVQVTPTELILSPGAEQTLEARLFDEKGRFIRTAKADWSLEGLPGTISSDGKLTIAPSAKGSAGVIKASVDGLTGTARARVIPPLPWMENFDNHKPGPPPPQWVSATGKFEIREMEGSNVLVKLADNPATQRARTYMGPADWHDYEVQVDARATEKRRQMGDAGVVAQRYSLVLFGSHQRLELFPWQADPSRTVKKPFEWKKDSWYRMKLRVENMADNTVRARGKVWPVGETEPDGWTIENNEKIPNYEGSPGIYADAPFEIFFDNFKVTPNVR